MQPILVVFAFSPALIDCFSLAFLRTSQKENQGINWITREAITDAQSLNKCFPVPFDYFDIAQFIPDNAPPGYISQYKVQKVYDPDKNLYWISIPNVSVNKVEFYTGTDCKNAVYEGDDEGALRMSRANLRKSSEARPAAMQLPYNMPNIPEEDEDENYYPDFDVDMTESEDIEQEIETQLNAGNLGLGTTTQEKMELEPPEDNETPDKKRSRQERNFLRFYEDVENDGGIALDSGFTTLQWSENWMSFKFTYISTAGSIVPNMGYRDL